MEYIWHNFAITQNPHKNVFSFFLLITQCWITKHWNFSHKSSSRHVAPIRHMYGDHYKPHLQTKWCSPTTVVSVFGLNVKTFTIVHKTGLNEQGAPREKWAAVQSLYAMCVIYCMFLVTFKNPSSVVCTANHTMQFNYTVFCLQHQKPNCTPILPAHRLCCSIQSGPQCWIGGQANISKPLAMLLAWLKHPPAVLCCKAIHQVWVCCLSFFCHSWHTMGNAAWRVGMPIREGQLFSVFMLFCRNWVVFFCLRSVLKI